MTRPSIIDKYKINKKLLFWIILTLIYFMRILYIDADIRAPWGVLNYQPFDEGCYSSMALSKINFNTIDPNNYYYKYDYIIAAHVTNNLVGNLFSYFTMFLFGDNYLGLRLGPVIAGYIITVLFVLILKELLYKYNRQNDLNARFAVLFFSVYLLFNFVFYNACRIVEPTLYRLLLLQIIVFLFVKQDRFAKLRYFSVAFLSVFSVFFVYITNVFIGVSLFMVLVFFVVNGEKAEARRYFICCITGGFAAYSVSFIYYYFVWGTTPIRNALEAIQTFQEVPTYGIASVSILHKIISFFTSNIFLYNPLLLSILGLGLPYYIYHIIWKKDRNILFLSGLITGLFLQTLLSEDYIVRKSLVIFPALIYLVFIYITDKNGENFYLPKCCYAVTGTGIMIFQIFCSVYRTFLIKNGTIHDFSNKDTILIFLLTGMSICYVLYFCLGKHCHKIFLKVIYAGLAGMILFNTAFIFKFNFYKNTYTAKAIMKQLGEIADGKIVCFSYENTNSLYNNILPLVCYEDQILEYMEQNPDIYYYGFEDFPTFNTDKDSLNQHVELCYRFDQEFRTFGIKRTFGLFRYKE